ncbi:MAG: GNAT family N-acetyltransferase [Firmicutes bacterium]|nr:GNAT family N-acetyltransferase [Bacillota bacterium]
MSHKFTIQQVASDNYHLFRDLVHWRVTGERKPAAGEPTGPELEFLKYEDFWVYAAQIGNAFVGWINAVLIPKPDRRRGLLYVDELWLAPEYRGKGIADALMEKVFCLARERELWKVRLYVGADNPSARSFYRRMGFVEDDELAVFCEWEVVK